jgi:SOS-response transcriptional repressor LexA
MSKRGRPTGGATFLENGLTTRQFSIYESLFEHTRKHGYQPTLRELCKMHGIGSPTAIRGHLLTLMSRGWIEATQEPSFSCRAVRFLRRPDGTPFKGFEQ